MMLTVTEFTHRVEEIVGATAVNREPSLLERYSVSGALPRAVISPTESSLFTQILEAAELHQGRLVIAGSGSKFSGGLQPEGEFLILSTLNMSGATDHDIPNFTVTARAGTTLSSLQETLAKERQFLPLDPPYRDATLGGTICGNSNGPLRLLYGGVRDLLLGARIALPGGRKGSFGGKVVKNVAGYDISRFLIGSMGTLSLLEEVTLKLFALPERESACAGLFESSGSALAAADQLRASRLCPARIVLLDRSVVFLSGIENIIHYDHEGYTLLISFHGFQETVDRQLRDTSEIFSAHGARETGNIENDHELWEKIRAFNQTSGNESAVTLKIGLPSSNLTEAVPPLLQRLKTWSGKGVTVDAGCGIIYIYLSCDDIADLKARSIAEAIQNIAPLIHGYGGHLSIENCPFPVAVISHIGANRKASHRVMELIRQKFDPGRTLCPERVPWLTKT